MSDELREVEEYLTNVKFKKQTFGGVSEADVMIKVQKLSDLYADAFRLQEAKYQALLEEKDKEIDRLRDGKA